MSLAAVMVVAMVLLLGGCGKNVPCNTDPSQIESARAELRTAEQQLQTAQAELTAAQKQKTQIESDMNRLADPAELESRLDILKKGSGR
jgi:outer membrane murein-binding lipoprotein Lpp